MQLNSEKEKLKSALSHYQQAKQDEAERIKQAKQEEAERIEYKRQEVLRRRVAFIVVVLGILALALGLGTLGRAKVENSIVGSNVWNWSNVWNFFCDLLVGCYKWDWEAIKGSLCTSFSCILNVPSFLSHMFTEAFTEISGIFDVVMASIEVFSVLILGCLAFELAILLGIFELMTCVVAAIVGLPELVVKIASSLWTWITGFF